MASALALLHAPDGAAPRAVSGGRDGCGPADCARCHPTIHDEWSSSRHARAWTDPAYQAALRGLSHPERCYGCHAPDRVLNRLGRPPRVRETDRQAGVECTACHDARGRIAGPLGTRTDAHTTEEHPAFSEDGSLHLCGSCHDTKIGPVLPLARDFVAAGLAEGGDSCIGCHMPFAKRTIAVDPELGTPTGAVRGGRSHALLGPDDREFCAQAFRVTAQRASERIEIGIANRAGHRVPGLVTRKFSFVVVQLELGGRSLRQDRFELSAENPLWVAETRHFRLPAAAGVARVEIVIHHENAAVAVELDRRSFDLSPAPLGR